MYQSSKYRDDAHSISARCLMAKARPILFAATFVTLWVVFCPAAIRAQSASAPQFEVASIRPSQLSDIPRAPMKQDPGIVIYNGVSSKNLIQLAYNAPEWKIVGGPKWLDSDIYDVSARLPSGSTKAQVPAMLQSLLAERFHPVIRRESRRLPLYSLTVAKNGPKLKSADPGEQWNEGTMRGGIFKGRLELHQLTMAGLAEVLAAKTGRPVVDNTHLEGPFDISLKWTPDDTTGTQTADGPSIFTALEEQLGLKLVAGRESVEVLRITRMEKPTEN